MSVKEQRATLIRFSAENVAFALPLTGFDRSSEKHSLIAQRDMPLFTTTRSLETLSPGSTSSHLLTFAKLKAHLSPLQLESFLSIEIL